MSDETHRERHRRLVRQCNDLRQQINVVEQRRWTAADVTLWCRLHDESFRALERALEEEQG